jgi:hypothetical protein
MMRMNVKATVIVVVLSGTLIAGGIVGEDNKHPEPKESRDTTFTFRSEAPQTSNVSVGVATGTIISALGLEFPNKK